MRFYMTDEGDFVQSGTGEIVIESRLEDNWRGHFKRYRRMQKQIADRYYAQRRIRDHEAAVAREKEWAKAVLAVDVTFNYQGYLTALRIMGIEPTPSEVEQADEEAKAESRAMVAAIHELWT